MTCASLPRRTFGAFSLLALLLGPGVASARTVVTIGTLAPKASTWGQLFAAWSRAVAFQSNDELALQVYYNGQAGDEVAMVGKLRAGQLDGAFLSATGLAKVYRPIVALQLPGLFTDWKKFDEVRWKFQPEFAAGAKEAGFVLAAWADIGLTRAFSKGAVLHHPADLQGHRPFAGRGDDGALALFGAIRGSPPVPLNVPEVLPNLQTNAVDVVGAPALVVEQLGWSAQLDTVNSDPFAVAVGALVYSNARIEALPENLRAVLLDTSKIAGSTWTKGVRRADDEAYARLKAKMTVVTLSAAEKAEWTEVCGSARSRLAGPSFDADLLARLEAAAR